VRLLTLDQGDVLVDVARLIPEDANGDAAVDIETPMNGGSADHVIEPTAADVEDPIVDALSDEESEPEAEQ
jgi:hypothetical protein